MSLAATVAGTPVEVGEVDARECPPNGKAFAL